MDRCPFESKLFGRDFIGAHGSLTHLGHASRGSHRDFVQPIIAMHDQRPVQPQHAECLSQGFDQFCRIDPNYLGRSLRRIGERPQ